MASRAVARGAAGTLRRAVRPRGHPPSPSPPPPTRSVANAACAPALLGRVDGWRSATASGRPPPPAPPSAAGLGTAAAAPAAPTDGSSLLPASAGGLGTDARMAAVSQLVDGRRSLPNLIPPDATVSAAVRKMVDLNAGSLLVVSPAAAAPPSADGGPQRIATGGDGGDDGARLCLCGILTERDYMTMALSGRSPDTTRVADVMSRDVITVAADATVGDCMRVMSANHIRHLPVLDGPTGEGELLGLVSMRDVVAALADDHERTLRYLHEQIARLANVAHVGGGYGGGGGGGGSPSMASAAPSGPTAGWRKWFSA